MCVTGLAPALLSTVELQELWTVTQPGTSEDGRLILPYVTLNILDNWLDL